MAILFLTLYNSYKWRGYMFFKRIFTESLAHYSYVIGDQDELIIIDPQPEVDIYLDISLNKQMKITTILETHRNEDFLVGSKALADLCGATIYRSAYSDLNYEYGKEIKDGDSLDFEGFSIKALHTPGHTLGHMSYVLYHKDKPSMAFVGDALFFGDIGRFDFYGKENLDKMAGLIYDSIFNKLLALGDEVLMFPAHGAGSACGESIENRPYSTLGYERKHNKKLQYKTKSDFVKANSKMLYKPEYFDHMEEVNLKGSKPIDCNLDINIKSIQEIDFDNEYVVDIRDQDAFNRAHIPNSIWIKRENILSFINWLIKRNNNISIVSSGRADYKAIYQDLLRVGYTKQISFVANAIVDLYASAEKVASIETVLPKYYKKNKEEFFILDVRKDSEADIDYGDGGMFIPIEEIRDRYQVLKSKENILVVCPSGIRSNIVVSYLKSKNINAKLLIGGLDAVV